MRKISVILMTVLLIAVPLVNAQGDPAQTSLEWLVAQQIEDGSYSEAPIETAIAATTLGLLGEPDAAAINYLDAYIAETEEVDLTTSSFIILAAVANDVDPSTLGDGALVSTFSQRLGQARGKDIGELCIGLLAMNAMGQTLPSTALMGLGLFQLENGGFAEESNGTVASMGITGLCLPVLVLAENEEGLTNAIDFLAENQNENGSWGSDLELPEQNNFSTTLIMMGLHSTGEDLLADWGSAVNYLVSEQDEDGALVMFLGAEEPSPATTAFSIMIFRGLDFLSIGATAMDDMGDDDDMTDDMGDDTDTASASDAPAMDENWAVVQEGFEMSELDSADDFLVTVVDPFTEEELYGVQIINWVAEYSYTGFIIERFLPAEVLLWLAEADATTWDNLNDSTLELLPAEELAKLPEDIQVRIQ